MRTGLAAAAAALTLLLIIPTAASAKRMLPWPSDAYTKRDKRTDTGVRLNLRRADMPRNKNGRPIDPADINRADGFSPGSALLLKVPGLDTAAAVRQSKLPPLTNLRRGLRSRSPILVFNARTGKRHPIWAELDSNARRRRDRLLIIRPARNFKEGARYVVVLRNLRDARGRRIDVAGIRGRHAGRIRRAMRKVDTGRHVYTAWDFTVASQRSLAGRMLHIRNDAFRTLGDTNLRDLTVAGSSPAFTVDAVTALAPAEDDRIARKVEGTLTVPCYLTNRCAPGGRFSLNRRGLPRRLGTTTAKFHCNIQGGIMGGGLTAVAPDFDRAVLGVPGMNYSTLLQRSVDFDAYAAISYPNYRKVIDRQLWMQHIQLLWDRAEANGYAHHMTSDPLPNTPRHEVLMHVAFGDHQVSDTAAEVQARTIGARGYRPVLDPGRSPWRRFQLIPSIGSFPFSGSAIVMWDTGASRTVGTEAQGTDAPPAGNTPNRSGDDPHDNPRATPSARMQKSEFLKVGGQVVDVCGGAPCHAVP